VQLTKADAVILVVFEKKLKNIYPLGAPHIACKIINWGFDFERLD
jgi:hypothetical protein